MKRKLIVICAALSLTGMLIHDRCEAVDCLTRDCNGGAGGSGCEASYCTCICLPPSGPLWDFGFSVYECSASVYMHWYCGSPYTYELYRLCETSSEYQIGAGYNGYPSYPMFWADCDCPSIGDTDYEIVRCKAGASEGYGKCQRGDIVRSHNYECISD